MKYIFTADAYNRYTVAVMQAIDKAVEDGILRADDSEGYSYLSEQSFAHQIEIDPKFAAQWGDISEN